MQLSNQYATLYYGNPKINKRIISYLSPLVNLRNVLLSYDWLLAKVEFLDPKYKRIYRNASF